ncbi:MAG: EAL domain-containing protein [Steroidobacteraceae bacterium]
MSRDATLHCDFSPYAQLVAALLPRATGLTIFEPDGELRWTSTEESVSQEFPKLVAASVITAHTSSEAGERVLLGRDEPAYLYWLRDDAGTVIAVLALTWRGAESDARGFSYAHAMLRPVLETLRRELVLRARLAQLPAPPQSEVDDTDLQVLLSTAETEHREVADDGLQELLQKVNHHLRCEFTALVVPERNLVTVVKAEGSQVDTSVLARLHRHLLSLAQLRKEAVLLNEPDSLPGFHLPFRVLAATLRNPAGKVAGVLAMFRSAQIKPFRGRDGMLADLLARRAAGIIDSSYDVLSGVLTRKAFEQRARMLLSKRSADGRRGSWSCLYLDADRMHAINDNYGMPLGDRLIAKLGELIRSRMVPGALAARMSGDRFAILLPTNDEDAGHFAEALRAGVEKLTVMHLGGAADSSFQASISIGVAAVNDPHADLAHALAVTETACKAAKDRGRNRVELYQVSDLSIMRRYEDINIAPTLRAALVEGRVRLDAQLIAPLPGNGATKPHYELLLRMIDDNGESVGPARFLSAAIRYQLMPEIDRWVVQEALRLLQPHADLLADVPVVFTINISGQSLVDDLFVEFLIPLIRASGINPKVLCFELTESAAVANLSRAETMMKRLRELGCSIALDDFGTGLSSLAYLRALPIDMLKIDGSFVRDVLKDPRAESMVQAIAQLARSMQLVTVAEYVETEEIRLRVASLGVDYGQGFAISRPAPLAEALRDLPTYALLARAGGAPHEEIVLGAEDDTIAAELQEQLQRELREQGISIEETAEDIELRMRRVLEGYDHSEAALYQHKAAG